MPFINGIGPGELIIILIIALIVVGPGKLPDVGSALGKSIREFRKAATDVKESVSLDPAPAPTATAPAAQAPVPVAAPAEVPAAVSAPPVVPVAAAVAAAVTPAPAVAEVAEASADGGTDPDAGSWPAEVTPVDEQQPTASA
jgi:TatA/E family protein of Tat protein translocase